MKLQFAIFPFLLLVSASCIGQITITQSTFPPDLLGSDTLKVTTYNSAFPLLPTGAGLYWDLGTITDSPAVFFDNRVFDSGFSFGDSLQATLFIFEFQNQLNSIVNTEAYEVNGTNVTKERYSLASLTAGFTDSLIIDSQQVVYSSPRTVIAFPATYGSSWSSDYVFDTHFHLSISVFSYDHTPAFVRTYVSERSNVTGWGHMRIPDITGGASDYWPVLQVQRITATSDSFFAAGAPINPSFLTLTATTQGQKDTVYEEDYYRLGEVTPLAAIQFRDAAFTQPYKCTTHVERLVNTGIAGIRDRVHIRAYPNPVSGNDLIVCMDAVRKDVSFALQNVDGRRISLSAGFSNTASQANISLPGDTTPGVYLLLVTDNNGAVIATTPIIIQR